jgi:hypothetical protein
MMAIEISEDAALEQLRVTFTIPDEGDDAATSVVGSFNDWLAGADTFVARGDGLLGVTVTLVSEDDVHFRYLRAGGIWFDDDEADEITSFGSVIRAPRSRLSPSATTPADQAGPAAAAPTDDAASLPTDSDTPPPAKSAKAGTGSK